MTSSLRITKISIFFLMKLIILGKASIYLAKLIILSLILKFIGFTSGIVDKFKLFFWQEDLIFFIR